VCLWRARWGDLSPERGVDCSVSDVKAGC
jgi:hypothetical protein